MKFFVGGGKQKKVEITQTTRGRDSRKRGGKSPASRKKRKRDPEELLFPSSVRDEKLFTK